MERESNILATRAGEELFLEVNKLCPDAVYHPLARAITSKKQRQRCRTAILPSSQREPLTCP